MRSNGVWRMVLTAGLLFGAFAGSEALGRTGANTPPVIAGTPVTAVEAGQFYSFRPQASDADGDRLAFSITNKPAWAAFNRKSGQLSGTPSAANVGTVSGIRIQVSDRASSVALPPFSLTVTAAPASNSAPVISGSPATTARVGSSYSFLPRVSDADGDALVLSIVNKPAWLFFDPANGALIGVPGDENIGTTTGVTIWVSDGIARTSLAPFDITVIPATEATLSWVAPTMREDGTSFSLSDIGGYRIYHGITASQLNVIADYQDPTGSRYTVTNLGQGTHYFAVTVYDNAGAESGKSSVLAKTIQ